MAFLNRALGLRLSPLPYGHTACGWQSIQTQWPKLQVNQLSVLIAVLFQWISKQFQFLYSSQCENKNLSLNNYPWKIKQQLYLRESIAGRLGSLENRIRDGELHARGLLGNDLGTNTCVETKRSTEATGETGLRGSHSKDLNWSLWEFWSWDGPGEMSWNKGRRLKLSTPTLANHGILTAPRKWSWSWTMWLFFTSTRGVGGHRCELSASHCPAAVLKWASGQHTPVPTTMRITYLFTLSREMSMYT